ncbi:hypothetical protein EC957_004862 [Mortierella hygrophila]|uniref:F-box domain-containing protein n=1 Tax=Mortierella hygrophila TaxID=979708 RepID=A0A9P6F1Q4_9FUNG|nr:hypothetical protein EC957_004862 [Mortierella hygrophila]
MAPIRRSRRLEQKTTDAQEEAESATATHVTAETAAPAPTARKTASSRKKAAAIGPKAAPADTFMTGPAAQSKTKKPKSTRKTLTTTTATTTSAPKKVRATTKTTTKAIATAAKGKEAKPKAKAVKKVKEESTTPEEKAAKPRAKRAKNSKNDTSSRAEVGAEEMEPKVKTKRARGVKKVDGDTTTSTASAGRKKRKADPEDYGTDGNSEGTGTASLTQVGPVTKKHKTMRGKKTGAVEHPKSVVINRSDPYSVLPTELWQEVISYLSLSQITKASSVSKSWLEGTQSLQVWRDICTNGSLGKPKKKYPTHMSLVCAQSYWVCERCLTVNNGKGSNIPLPVEIAELGNEKRMLCRACRCSYYKKHPEKIKLRKNVMNHYGEYIAEREVRITKTDACSKFHLTTEDLSSLSYMPKQNPRYRNAAPMKLYLERKVQKLSLEIHGGWIGIQAVGREVAKTRRADAKERAQGLQTLVVQSTGEEKTEKNKDTSSTKGKMAMTQAVALATYDDDIKRWVKLLHKPQRRALVVEAIAETERRIAAGEPPLVIDYRSVTPDHEWIDTLRFVLDANDSTREEIKKIIQYLEAGVYDALQVSCASSTEAAAGAEVGAMRLAEVGSSSSMAAVLPPAMDTTFTVA